MPEDIRKSAQAYGGVFRSYQFKGCKTDADSSASHPVDVEVFHGDTQQVYNVKAKYLLGCDGARSLVRRAISGGEQGDGEYKGKIRMEGEATDIIWGVMDVAVKTDFPDIKSKCLIHSKDAGSIMVIPRENNLCRFYVQLQQSEDGSTHVERSKATMQLCIDRARKIFEPFKFDVSYVDWFSVYQIGQRIASNYTLDCRVFLGGDATHTHSPKAGQGMNISMLDMYSLAWRLNLVEKGVGNRDILLPTYESERRSVAQELLRFDSEYSRLFSGKSPRADQLTDDKSKASSVGAVDAQRFIEVFKKNAFFTSGCGAIYFANVLNALPDSDIVKSFPKQGVFNFEGSKLIAGQRLLPGKLTRAVDANQVRLQQEVKMNGAFRIHLFAGEYKSAVPKLQAWDRFLSDSSCFFNRYRPRDGVQSSMVDGPGMASQYIEVEQRKDDRNPFFTFLTILATPHTEWDIEELPYHIRNYRAQVYGDDLFDRRVADAGTKAPVHTKYGLQKDGGIVVARPDGYVGAVVPFNEDGFEALNHYFSGFMSSPTGPAKL